MDEILNSLTFGNEFQTMPLVIAHGLFGSARNWRVLAKRLAASRPVVAVDMRNHGLSFRSARHDYPAMAEDLAAVIDGLGGRAHVLGHSMGGKAAMTLAVTRADCVASLIVADIAPVTYGHSQLPLIEAMQALDLAALGRRSDGDAALARGVADPAVRAFLLQSLEFGADGAHWALNLPVLAAEMPSIIGFPNLGGRYEGPALFLRGGASDYVLPEHLPRIAQLFPASEHVELAGAGHWLHAEAPRPFEAAVASFLERLG